MDNPTEHVGPLTPAPAHPSDVSNFRDALTAAENRQASPPLHPPFTKAPAVEDWPHGDPNPGDQEQLIKLSNSLAAITDVNSLETVLHMVASRCKTHRVHPDKIRKAFVNTGVPLESRTTVPPSAPLFPVTPPTHTDVLPSSEVK